MSPASILLVTLVAAGPASLGGLDLSDMDKDERALFDKVVGGEICPCGAAMSLARCLDRDDVCDRARQAAALVADGVRKGVPYAGLVDGLIRFLEASAKPREFSLEGRPFKGDPKARVVIVEFSDYECPHCNKIRATFGKLLSEVPKGVAVYLKHYPLPFHQHAANAAAAAEVAQARGAFWKMHDAIFDHQAELSEPLLQELLKQAGIDPKGVTQAEWEAAKKRVLADRAEGEEAGLGGTPTLFLNGVEMSPDDYATDRLVERVREALRATGK